VRWSCLCRVFLTKSVVRRCTQPMHVIWQGHQIRNRMCLMHLLTMPEARHRTTRWIAKRDNPILDEEAAAEVRIGLTGRRSRLYASTNTDGMLTSSRGILSSMRSGGPRCCKKPTVSMSGKRSWPKCRLTWRDIEPDTDSLSLTPVLLR
jgi:hypothetical protein